MKVVMCGPYKLEIHDSIETLPPHKEAKMQYYQMSEFGIGHTWNAIDEHLNGILLASGQNDAPALMQHIENLRICYFTMASQYNPEHLSWLCLIHKIDGQPFDDLTHDTLSEWAAKLTEHDDSEFAWKQVFDEVKKKFPTSFESSFQNSPLLQTATFA